MSQASNSVNRLDLGTHPIVLPTALRFARSPITRIGRFAPIAEQVGDRITPLFIAVVLLSGGISVAAAADPMASVIVATVGEAEVGAGHRVVGTVRPLRTSTIGSAADGRVLEFLVQVGDAVKKGQPLAKLRTDTLKIELAAAEAELDLYKHQMAELQNGARPEEIAEAQANLMGAKAAMESAAKSLRRIKSLVESRATSASDLDVARERAEFTRHSHSASEALLERIQQGARTEQIAQAAARVELQSQRINLINDRIGKFTIRAPFDGYVAEEYTEVGAWMSQGDPVVRVIQLDEVEIEAPITAEYAVHLRRGDTIRVEFPELPSKLIMGTVDRVVPVADERARTFPIFIRLTNEFHDATPLFMSGMLVRVDLPSGKKERIPLVPKDALVLNAARRSVYVLEPSDDNAESLRQPPPSSKLQASTSPSGESSDQEKAHRNRGKKETGDDTGIRNSGPDPDRSVVGTVREVSVTLGVAVEDRIQVRGDVHAGDLVVVLGNERLKEGDRVTVQGYYAGDSMARTDSTSSNNGRSGLTGDIGASD